MLSSYPSGTCCDADGGEEGTLRWLHSFLALLKINSGAVAIEYGAIAELTSVVMIGVVAATGTKLHTGSTNIGRSLKPPNVARRLLSSDEGPRRGFIGGLCKASPSRWMCRCLFSR